ncbi:hypothetical protein KUCAC02_007358 [Chaenocephalus aceratus]|uniref:Uncharacterized protein n=1 Tax=Chaenocephalus aceratus TaxID=36190 RepID=A0ACB9X606_CHAAC|nr:hypothetical protein KUCAC02_007358 [Chaenocephalus aceratus]
MGRSPLCGSKNSFPSEVNCARCGLDPRLGPCMLHGVLRSHTSPPHYRPDCCCSSTHTLKFYALLQYCFIVSIGRSEELVHGDRLA